jgi:NAD(P)-dependent dehydrogenase (short-subunit alcohol dehydrogenase family)
MNTGPLDEAIGPVPLLSTQDLSFRVKGKHALIIGGTRGVGFGTALALAAAGAHVTIVGRSTESGDKAVYEIQKATTDSGSVVNYIQGDIGTVCNCVELIRKLEEANVRYDFAVVSAATFPDWTQPLQSEDGVDKSFGIAALGRFMMYRNMHRFMKANARILNVLASGDKLPVQMWDKDLALGKKNVSGLVEGILNFALANEIMIDSLYKFDDNFSTGTFTMVSTHPGMLKTDLHRGQGLAFDIIEGVMVALIGVSEETAGVRQASNLIADKLHKNELSFVDQFGYGRLRDQGSINFISENAEWLWSLLTGLENKSSTCHVDD